MVTRNPVSYTHLAHLALGGDVERAGYLVVAGLDVFHGGFHAVHLMRLDGLVERAHARVADSGLVAGDGGHHQDVYKRQVAHRAGREQVFAPACAHVRMRAALRNGLFHRVQQLSLIHI